MFKSLKPALGDVWSLANYSVAYEETQSNQVSYFCDFECSLFPKAIFYFIVDCEWSTVFKRNMCFEYFSWMLSKVHGKPDISRKEVTKLITLISTT